MLDSKQCEAFLAVAELGSFDAAGEHYILHPRQCPYAYRL